jgi:hypothetical protein
MIEDDMTEDLKNIACGFWYMGVAGSLCTIVFVIGYFALYNPWIMIPTLVVFIAWIIGKIMR